MKKRIFVTGASGFVGRHVLRELISRDYFVHALARKTSAVVTNDNIRVFEGDLFDGQVLKNAMDGCDAAIHLVGIIMEDRSRNATFERIHVEGTRAVVQAAQENGIRRYIQMSALGARANAPTQYHRTKAAAEEIVKSSGMSWTILRPSLIHGPDGEFMRVEAKWARGKAPPFLFMPYFGSGLLGTGGAGLLQPVFVDDVARAFVDALENPATENRTFEIGGPERISWPAMHEMVSTILRGKKKTSIAIPTWWAKILTQVTPAKLLPFNRDQIEMSQEDNVCDLAPFEEAFGWKPREFRAMLQQYASQL